MPMEKFGRGRAKNLSKQHFWARVHALSGLVCESAPMIFSKIVAFVQASRALGRPPLEGLPFLPKRFFSVAPFNREAYNTFVVEAVGWRLGRSPLICDVGANNGDFALACARAYPGAKVMLFEPIPSHLTRLRALQKAGPFEWDVCPFALGSRSETLQIEIPEGQEAASSLHGFSEAYLSSNPRALAIVRQQCEVRRLDDLEEANGGSRRIDLLKMDVEGYEFSVVEGAEKTLLRVDRVVVEVSRVRHSEEPGCPVARMVEKLASAGLSLFRMQPTIMSAAEPSLPLEYDLYFRRWGKISQ